MTIIATKGTLDWAYPPFILAFDGRRPGLGRHRSSSPSTACNLLKKDISDLKVSPLGNPGMPMKMPFGPDWFKGINWNIPNLIQAGIPGFESVATMLMKQTIKNNGVADDRGAARPVAGGRRQVHRLPDDGRPVRLHATTISSEGDGILPARRRSCRGAARRTSACTCDFVARMQQPIRPDFEKRKAACIRKCPSVSESDWH